MAKTKSNRNGGNQGGTWSNADHDARTAKRLASLNKKRLRQQQRRQSSDGSDNDDHDDEHTDGRGRKKKRQNRPREDEPLHRIRLKKRSGRDDDSRLSKHVPENVYKRTHLAHDDVEKARLRLVTARLQRKVDALRARLEDWDPLEDHHDDDDEEGGGGCASSTSAVGRRMELDAANRKMDVEAREKASAERSVLQARHGVNSSTHRRKNNLRKRARPGPESWKLRGAARPAHEVYDFDVRYVDVHRIALDEANARARRVVNVMKACRGRFASEDGDGVEKGEGGASSSFPPPQPHCRRYLSLLTQLGSIHLHRKNYSSARRALLEAVDLEGYDAPSSITNARYRLMNMYLSCNRPESARELWTRLRDDGSAWVRYSEALIEYASWNVLNEKGSTAKVAESALARAIRGNVYAVYLLGWSRTFERAMEYTDEVVGGGIMVGKEGGSLLEAIEYCCRCYHPSSSSADGGDGTSGRDDDDDDEDRDAGMAMWMGTEGSLDWVRSVVLRVLNENGNEDNGEVDEGGRLDLDRLTKADLLCWEGRLNVEEEEFERARKEMEDQWALSGNDAGVEASCNGNGDGDGDGDGDDASGRGDNGGDEVDEEGPDVPMYAGMFRTAMDWLQDAGEFLKEPSFDYVCTGDGNAKEGGAISVGDDDDDENDDDDDDDDDHKEGKDDDTDTSVHDDDSSSEDGGSSSGSGSEAS